MKCAFETCDRPAKILGLCKAHDTQRRRGLVLAPLGRGAGHRRAYRPVNTRWPTQEERFWGYVDKNGPVIRPELGPCWKWTGPVDTHGYGQLHWDGVLTLASRVSMKIAGIDLAPGECALHRCDNPPCPNPLHLFAGTKKANYDDMVEKGRDRHVTGVDNGMAKVTEFDAATIRISNAPDAELARLHGISGTQVRNIKAGRSWSHVRMD